MHPHLIASLAHIRRNACPCGARSDEPFGLCRKCQARAAWRRHNQRTLSRRRRTAARLARRVARLMAVAYLGLRPIDMRPYAPTKDDAPLPTLTVPGRDR